MAAPPAASATTAPTMPTLRVRRGGGGRAGSGGGGRGARGPGGPSAPPRRPDVPAGEPSADPRDQLVVDGVEHVGPLLRRRLAVVAGAPQHHRVTRRHVGVPD